LANFPIVRNVKDLHDDIHVCNSEFQSHTSADGYDIRASAMGNALSRAKNHVRFVWQNDRTTFVAILVHGPGADSGTSADIDKGTCRKSEKRGEEQRRVSKSFHGTTV
jgi:hypothetical protein|tara:strand:- start:2653 stop:2976 length:324 start_codon:yes stop_codon:yes gene_type:complete